MLFSHHKQIGFQILAYPFRWRFMDRGSGNGVGLASWVRARDRLRCCLRVRLEHLATGDSGPWGGHLGKILIRFTVLLKGIFERKSRV